MKPSLRTAVWVVILAAMNPALAQEWVQTSAPITNWSAIASSADGTKLVAVVSGTQPSPIYTSTNAGLTWMRTSAPLYYWSSVTSSADGKKLAATGCPGCPMFPIYTSTNSGVTWTPHYSNYWA